ncbi:MAG: Chromate resistance protein ChrB [Gemmatimonadaceae bacterium]
MTASDESSTLGASSGQARWLLFLHQLPPTPDYLRVKVRRRLQRLGAVALRNAVYVLPLMPDALEDFRWLRREIVDAGGEATLCASELLEGVSDADIEALLSAERNAEYDQVLEAVRALGAEPAEHDVARLRRQLRHVVARDYMDAPGRQAAEQAVAAIDHPHARGGAGVRVGGAARSAQRRHLGHAPECVRRPHRQRVAHRALH